MQNSGRDGAIALRWWFEPHDPHIRVRVVDVDGDRSVDVLHGIPAALERVRELLVQIERDAQMGDDGTARDADATRDEREP